MTVRRYLRSGVRKIQPPDGSVLPGLVWDGWGDTSSAATQTWIDHLLFHFPSISTFRTEDPPSLEIEEPSLFAVVPIG